MQGDVTRRQNMNNDVPKIQLGLAQINSKAAKAEKKPEEKTVAVEKQETKTFEDKSAQVMDALGVAGQYNVATLGIAHTDPSKYLTPERIADIEASMVVFDKGVKTHYNALKDEFGHLSEFGSISEADKFEMAAKSFAQNG